MNAMYINAVFRASQQIFKDFFGDNGVKMLQPKAGQITVQGNDVSVIVGIHGELTGQVICSMRADVTKKLVAQMLGEDSVEELDEMCWSAIQEFGNWVAGASATELALEGVIVDVNTPVVNEGTSKFHSNNIFLTIPLETFFGIIEVHVSLLKND